MQFNSQHFWGVSGRETNKKIGEIRGGILAAVSTTELRMCCAAYKQKVLSIDKHMDGHTHDVAQKTCIPLQLLSTQHHTIVE